IIHKIKAWMHSNANHAESEQRYYNSAEAFHQTLIVCRFPHCDVPTQIAPYVLLLFASAGRSERLQIEFLEALNIRPCRLPCRFFSCETFKYSTDRHVLL